MNQRKRMMIKAILLWGGVYHNYYKQAWQKFKGFSAKELVGWQQILLEDLLESD